MACRKLPKSVSVQKLLLQKKYYQKEKLPTPVVQCDNFCNKLTHYLKKKKKKMQASYLHWSSYLRCGMAETRSYWLRVEGKEDIIGERKDTARLSY